MSAGFEVRVRNHLNERNQELILVLDGLHFVVGIEDFGFIQTQRLGDVLISVCVNGLFKSLTQQKLTAFWRGDMAVRTQHDIVSS